MFIPHYTFRYIIIFFHQNSLKVSIFLLPKKELSIIKTCLTKPIYSEIILEQLYRKVYDRKIRIHADYYNRLCNAISWYNLWFTNYNYLLVYHHLFVSIISILHKLINTNTFQNKIVILWFLLILYLI